jgi:hypothetical protein
MVLLSIEKAFEFYAIFKKYIPENFNGDGILIDYIAQIIDKIKAGRHRDYFDMVLLLSGMKEEELIKLPAEEILGLFVEGLKNNQILSLVEFCNTVGI